MRRVICALLTLLLITSLTSIGAVSAFAAETPASIVLKTQESGSLTIANKWQSAVIVSQVGYVDATVTPYSSLTRTVSADQTITVKESVAGTTFRLWGSGSSPFVKGVNCAITSMPALTSFTADSMGTISGSNYFSCFNNYGSLTSLPSGSFDTSNITTFTFLDLSNLKKPKVT